MNESIKIAKGVMVFAFDVDHLISVKHDKDTVMKDLRIGSKLLDTYLSYDETEFYDGLDFVKDIKSDPKKFGEFNSLRILVDGYVTNLGIFTKFNQIGEFLISDESFERLCNDHEVKISLNKE